VADRGKVAEYCESRSGAEFFDAMKKWNDARPDAVRSLNMYEVRNGETARCYRPIASQAQRLFDITLKAFGTHAISRSTRPVA